MNPPSLELSHKKDTSHCGKCPPVMQYSVVCADCAGYFVPGGVMTSGGLCPKGMRRQEGDMPRWTRWFDDAPPPIRAGAKA